MKVIIKFAKDVAKTKKAKREEVQVANLYKMLLKHLKKASKRMVTEIDPRYSSTLGICTIDLNLVETSFICLSQ